MSNKLFKRFSEHEDTLISKYEKHPLFSLLPNLSDKEFINLLTQYGEGISANFVKFLETVLRQVENSTGQQAILSILRDEIPAIGPTHQQMRSSACKAIGITPTELASINLTKVTEQTINNYYSFVRESKKLENRDLALVTFARVIGESLVGVVYKHLTNEIIRRFNVKENDIKFYSFHWHHDEKGGVPAEGLDFGHTEYYDLALKDLLKTEKDLVEAISVANTALEIRMRFQDQFLK